MWFAMTFHNLNDNIACTWDHLKICKDLDLWIKQMHDIEYISKLNKFTIRFNVKYISVCLNQKTK